MIHHKMKQARNNTVRQIPCPLVGKIGENRDQVRLIHLQYLVDIQQALVNICGLNVRAQKMTWKNRVYLDTLLSG